MNFLASKEDSLIASQEKSDGRIMMLNQVTSTVTSQSMEPFDSHDDNRSIPHHIIPPADQSRPLSPELLQDSTSWSIRTVTKEEDDNEHKFWQSDDTTEILFSESSMDETTGKNIRRKWDIEDHRELVSQIFEIGLRNASPSVILENMKHANSKFVTKERVKSHLQKYRLGKDRSKSEFLADYDKCVRRGSEKYQSFKHNNGINTFSDQDDILSILSTACLGEGSAHIAASLSIACMMEDDTSGKDENLAFSINKNPKKISEILDLEGILTVPALTEDEKASPIGRMMVNIVGCFHSIQNRLQEKRGEEIDEIGSHHLVQNSFPKKQSLNCIYSTVEKGCNDEEADSLSPLCKHDNNASPTLTQDNDTKSNCISADQSSSHNSPPSTIFTPSKYVMPHPAMFSRPSYQVMAPPLYPMVGTHYFNGVSRSKEQIPNTLKPNAPKGATIQTSKCSKISSKSKPQSHPRDDDTSNEKTSFPPGKRMRMSDSNSNSDSDKSDQMENATIDKEFSQKKEQLEETHSGSNPTSWKHPIPFPGAFPFYPYIHPTLPYGHLPFPPPWHFPFLKYFPPYPLLNQGVSGSIFSSQFPHSTTGSNESPNQASLPCGKTQECRHPGHCSCQCLNSGSVSSTLSSTVDKNETKVINEISTV